MNSDFEKVINESPAVLVDFYADWCEPCKMVVPVLKDIEEHFKGRLKLHMVDIDTHTELSRSLSILSVPTLILFSKGKEVWRIRGFDVAPKLIETLSKLIS